MSFHSSSAVPTSFRRARGRRGGTGVRERTVKRIPVRISPLTHRLVHSFRTDGLNFSHALLAEGVGHRPCSRRSIRSRCDLQYVHGHLLIVPSPYIGSGG